VLLSREREGGAYSQVTGACFWSFLLSLEERKEVK